MKKIASIILCGLTMASCVDTVLLPDDKTVEEDFWKTKSDVALMVNGAYKAMCEKDVQERLIVWTSRSDEMNVNATLNNSALNQIHSANIQTTNAYNQWASIYAVINDCNLVLKHSADVMSIDPNYLEGDHRNNIGQMKALRALCYFYLVRTFRDVPLVLEPYKLSSQEMNVSQVAPSVVIDQIIADLEEVKGYTLSSQSVTGSDRCAYFTRDGVYALLADVYLWKASVFGDESCYDKCIACCNEIRKNRKSVALPGNSYNGGLQQLDDDGYDLNTYNNYENIFLNGGNDSESLFELQFTNNEGLCMSYNRSKNNNTLPNFYTNTVYAQIAADENHIFNHDNYKYDVRGFASIHDFNAGGEEALTVRKFVAQDPLLPVAASTEWKGMSKMERAYGSYDQNWIFYRVTDVMLMKAEALVQKAALKAQAHAGLLEQIANPSNTSADSLELAQELHQVNRAIAACNVEAARQVQIVSTRARTDGKSEVDSMKYDVAKAEYDGGDIAAFVRTQVNAFSGFTGTAEELEVLVMNERARELCFEGKRWFDMLRYNYRHTTGVNYDLILAQQGGIFAPNYEGMLKLIARKYTSGGGSGVTSKMPTEPYLYMPLSYDEVNVNPLLYQNPVYTDGATTEKNY